MADYTKVVKYTVKKGDTLSGIASANLSTYGKQLGYSNYKDYMNKFIAKQNNIENVNLIYAGEKLIIYSPNGKTVNTSSAKNDSKKATVDRFGIVNGTDEKTLFATWKWSKDHTDRYKTRWRYSTGDGVSFIGKDSDSTTAGSKYDTFDIPSNAVSVTFYVQPVSTKKKVKNKNGKETETSYWTAEWSDAKTHNVVVAPAKPSAPSLTIEGKTLTCSVANITDATHVEFQIAKDDKVTSISEKIKIVTTAASITRTITVGHEYKVRCRTYKGSVGSEWSDYSANETTMPADVKEITSIKARSETSVFLDWSHISTATSYEIQHTTDKSYFDKSGEVTTTPVQPDSESDKPPNSYIITGLDTGEEYFFRVRAKNGKGESAWTAIKSVKLGIAPSAPTTWSSTTTAVQGQDKTVTFYWVHNSEDGSAMTSAQFKVYVGDAYSMFEYPVSDPDEDDVDKIHSKTIRTSAYDDGVNIKWQIRTKGILDKWSPWSTLRTIKVYAEPEVVLEVLDALNDGDTVNTLTAFPFYIKAKASSTSNQKVIGYHLSIVSNSEYETEDELGNFKMVKKGDVMFSKQYDSPSTLEEGVSINPKNIDLANGKSYVVKVVASMNSGLTATNTHKFKVSWSEQDYEPDAEIGIDKDTLSAVIQPHCEYYEKKCFRVLYDEDTDEYQIQKGWKWSSRKGTLVEDAYAEFRDDGTMADDDLRGQIDEGMYPVYKGTDGKDELSEFYTELWLNQKKLVPSLLLSVYRREFDGTFTELAVNINNSRNTYVVDPHPSLDYARYRIVATSKLTGAVGYWDLPGYPVGESSIVIQWAEEWSEFDTDDGNAQEDMGWTGSMLKLPYDICVSDSNAPDVELVEYIGRENPVAYYGTQQGYSSTWTTNIPKDDKETLYALRRLQRWMGDVYVREPSGSGYWANIAVQFSQKSRDLVIPVTFNIKRVEGGA